MQPRAGSAVPISLHAMPRPITGLATVTCTTGIITMERKTERLPVLQGLKAVNGFFAITTIQIGLIPIVLKTGVTVTTGPTL